ncbi:MAG: peptidyl-prolyl cis-trans isomerase [Thermodesulfovibrionales bacterium]|nr:peptidyl-prolyl cis-trans isomerase [Thermodesulfovibrionales bacterium]
MKKILVAFLIMLLAIPVYAEETVVAVVNGTKLTMKELEGQVDRLIPRMTFHKNVPEEKRKNFYKQALDEIINRELLYQDALAVGMKPDKDKVNAQSEKIRQRFKSEEEYKAALEKEGIKEETIRFQIEKEQLVQQLNEKKVVEASRVTEEQLKNYYDKNTAQFKQPESVKLKIITTKDEQKAKDIQEKIKAGDDFGEIAYNFSEDSYRVKSGDIGYIHKGRMLPDIETAAFKLKTGEVSDLIHTEDSWFLIKVEDKKPDQQLSFEEVKEKLKREIEADKARELSEKLIADLRAKAKIEVLFKTE